MSSHGPHSARGVPAGPEAAEAERAEAARADAVVLDVRRRQRGRGFAICAAVAFSAGALDWLIAGRPVPAAFALRALWALQFLACGWLLTRVSPHVERHLYLGVAVLAPIFMAAVVLVTGVPDNPLIYWLLAMPPAAAAFVQHEVRAVLANAATSVLMGVALLALQGSSLRAQLIMVLLLATSSVVGVAGSFFFRRSRDAELASNRERLRALEELATSERRRAESERLAVVGRLAAGVAHEVNNPLAFVMANLHVLQRETSAAGVAMPAAEVQELLAETAVGLERIRQVVSDLRTFAREDAEQAEVCDVAEVAEEAVRIASVRLRHVAQVERVLPPGLPHASIPSRRLSQVLVNLLMNAADALEGKRPEGAACVQVLLREVPQGLELRVEDNGPGLSEATQRRLFEPFFTTKPPGRGTGLGLALSREYLQRYGGSLHAENRSSGGARFTLLLPRAPGASAATPGTKAPGEGAAEPTSAPDAGSRLRA